MASVISRLLNTFWFNGLFESSDRISYSNAISVPPVWFALNKLSEDTGQLPLLIRKLTRDGESIDETHVGYQLLMEQPNAMQSPSVFKQQITAHAIIWGNGRAAIIRDDNGVPVELLPMMPDETWSMLHKGKKYHITKPHVNNGKDLLEIIGKERIDGGFIAFEDKDVIHISGFSHDGVEGIGLLHIASNTFSIGYNAQKHYKGQLEKGFRGKLFVEAPPGRFRDFDDAKKFIEEFNESEGGSSNSYKASLLREGMKINAINMSNADSQFESMGKFNRQDVGMMFGIESMPGDGSPKSYNSLEQYNLMYGRALDRWLSKWEEQCDMKLRTDVQKVRRSHYFLFDRKAIYRTDRQIEVDTLCKLVQHEIYNPNEARDALGMNKRPGGDEFQNPSTSSQNARSKDSGQGQAEPDQPTEKSGNGGSTQSSRAAEVMVMSLLTTESNNAIRGAGSKNFVEWIEKNYSKWEPKLAEKLEAIGLDRDLARKHCDESRTILLEIAGSSTLESLEENVKSAVASWTNRVYRLLGENDDNPLQS